MATVLAPPEEILRFCAFHLRAGAHRIFLYLDDPDATGLDLLEAHPNIHVTRCSDTHWRAVFKKRPVKHQVRQTLNATHAYARADDLDWLAHIDVDEFIGSQQDVGNDLANLPATCQCARIRPVEPLSGGRGLFKAAVPRGPHRAQILAQLYPEFGTLLRDGLLSHVAGKLFVRTGLPEVTLRIHNMEQGSEKNPNQEELSHLRLAHMHAPDWAHFRAAFGFRLRKGAYRADLAPARPREQGGQTLHEVLRGLRNAQGNAGLQRFFEELTAPRPALLSGLEEHGLLHELDLHLDNALEETFPGTV